MEPANSPDPTLQDLPAPVINGAGHITPQWNSVALFFNLAASARPADYRECTGDAANLNRPGFMTLSEFTAHYWGTLSYGKFSCGVTTVFNADGTVYIPQIPMELNGQPITPYHWGEIIRLHLMGCAERAWEAT